MRRIAFLLLLLAASLPGMAQKVAFNINAPLVVGNGESFNVEFSLNAVPTDFAAPDFAGFEVLAGPSTSQGQSLSIVNGAINKSLNYAITYVLQATKTGKFTIQPATAKVDGTSYATRPLTIEVTDGHATGQQGGASGGQPQPQGGGGAASAKVSSEDLFAVVNVDRNNVFKGQPIHATIKLYSRVSISNTDNVKFPAFNGFWSQELNTGNAAQRERYNSREYSTQVVKEVLLYPQQSGTLTIEPFEMTATVLVVTQRPSQNIFDQMMGAGQDVSEVRRKVASQPVRITVKDLPPGAPASFNGAVGTELRLDVDAPKAPIPANSGGVVTIKISGTGNLPLIQAPKFTMPSAFEQYNVKTTESLTPSASGISGYRQFEYPFVARAEGSYNLGAVEFSYFSTDKLRYETLRSNPIEIEVVKDTSGHAGASQGGALMSALSKEDLKILGKDIRFIKLGPAGLADKGSAIFGSWGYWLAAALLVVLAAVAYVVLQKRIRSMKDSALVRSRKANKVALARLGNAERAMREGDRRNFYEEMLKALWGYMGDKLNIPAAMLTRESVREGLARRGVVTGLAEKYIGVISDCEYAQYSPGAGGQMGETYKAAVDVISKLESDIKR